MTERAELVRYTTDDIDIDPDALELAIHFGGNGDWYVAVVPQGDQPMHGVRITTSGTRAHGLAGAIAAAYRAISDAGERAILPRRTIDDNQWTPQGEIKRLHEELAAAEKRAEEAERGTPRCGMCGASAVCLSVDNEPPERAIFACADCCGCGGCANVHDAENPYCEAETGGCWRLVGIPEYVNSLRDDLNALDETTASRINELEQQLSAANTETERLKGAVREATLAHLDAMIDTGEVCP